MSQFEDFVSGEMPRRPVMLTAELCEGYVGDPNAPGAPVIVQNSPKGTFYLQATGNVLWKKNTSTAGSWEVVGSGSGGGGATPYATEAALLAATPTAGAMGYAQDMGDFWFRRAATWQKVPNLTVLKQSPGTPSASIRTSANIRMDAALGDDSEWNDGSVTPLKTLTALYKRIAGVMRGGSLTVHFAAGDYSIPSPFSYIDFPASVYFVGVFTAPFTTFSVDHYSGSDCHVHKPAGDPAWTVDEWVGYWVEVPGFSITAPARYPIIANGTHDLIIGPPTTSPWNYAPIGTTAKIVKPAVRFTGTGNIIVSSGTLRFLTGFLFERAPSTGSYFFQVLGTGSLTFSDCHFKGVSNTFIIASGPATYVNIRNMLIENGFGAVNCQSGMLELYGVTGLNTNRLLDGRGCYCLVFFYINGRNCNEFLFPAYRCWCVDRSSGVQMRNCGTLWDAINRENTVVLLNGLTVLDNQPPARIVQIGSGGRAHLSGAFAEAIVPADSIGIYAGGPFVSFSVADLEALYGGEYDYGNDTVVAKI